MYTIVEARTPDLIEQARALFREYAAGLDFSLDYQDFEQELTTLPGRYASPNGCLLLALSDSGGVGTAALRQIDPTPLGRTCEMKRLYVRPSHRGRGLGRALAERIIARGRELGYAAMRLDTGDDMLAARHVYESLGFRPIDRYNNDPHANTLYFELRLIP